MVWRSKKKLLINSKLAGTTMCKSLRVSVSSEKSQLGLEVSNSILCLSPEVSSYTFSCLF